MGRDKALLPYRGGFLVQYVAEQVRSAAGAATLIGDPQKYGGLGYPVVPDLRPGAGPLAGIHTALHHTSADWNLIVACDMPGISAEFLLQILEAAEKSGADVLLPAGPQGLPEPVCGAWHRRALAAVEAALDRGVRKVTQALDSLTAAAYPVPRGSHLENVNTPQEWAGHASD